jgi:phosphoglycolate phosphatase-like HAD superfamily hydrolase
MSEKKSISKDGADQAEPGVELPKPAPEETPEQHAPEEEKRKEQEPIKGGRSDRKVEGESTQPEPPEDVDNHDVLVAPDRGTEEIESEKIKVQQIKKWLDEAEIKAQSGVIKELEKAINSEIRQAWYLSQDLKDPAIAEDIQKREAEYDEKQQEAERLWRAILQKEKMEKFLDVPDLIQELKNLGFTGYAVAGDLDQRISEETESEIIKIQQIKKWLDVAEIKAQSGVILELKNTINNEIRQAWYLSQDLKDPAIAEDIQKREAEYDEKQQEVEKLWRTILQKEKMEKFSDVPDLIQEIKDLGFTGYAVEGDLDRRIADSSFKDPYKRFREARQELEIGISGNTNQLKLQKLETLRGILQEMETLEPHLSPDRIRDLEWCQTAYARLEREIPSKEENT